MLNFASERTPELPSGFFNWFGTFFKIPDSHVLNHSSMDGYLFLRFLTLLCSICFTGCVITWPILLPINAMGGAGNKQLDMLSFSNVKNPNWYYAHAIMGCILFGKSSKATTGPANSRSLRFLHGHSGESVLCASATGLPEFTRVWPSHLFAVSSVHVCTA